MPVKPENLARYPLDWPEISLRIRTVRAENRCECTGICGKHAGPDRCAARNGGLHPVTGSLVVLTTAHLDHQPENCADTNLAAFCQRCHLAYDGPHHAETRARTRAAALAAAGVVPLFAHIPRPKEQL